MCADLCEAKVCQMAVDTVSEIDPRLSKVNIALYIFLKQGTSFYVIVGLNVLKIYNAHLNREWALITKPTVFPGGSCVILLVCTECFNFAINKNNTQYVIN